MIRSDEHLIFLLLCSCAIAEYVVSIFNNLTKWLLIDFYLFGEFNLNYLLIGMSCSATIANIIKEDRLTPVMKQYEPLLNISLVIVIVNLGMPLDYRLIAGAGVFTAVYILSRAAGRNRSVAGSGHPGIHQRRPTVWNIKNIIDVLTRNR